MKNAYLISLVLFTTIIFFSGCGGGNGDLNGLYIAESVAITDCTDPSNEQIKEDFSQVPCLPGESVGCFYQAFDFISEDQVIVSNIRVADVGVGGGLYFDEVDTVSYSIESDELIICALECDTSQFEISGNTLTIEQTLEASVGTCIRRGIFKK